MQAGRELDALVAEKVFGEPLHYYGYDGLPRYSADIAAAWFVVEKFRRGCNGMVAACVDLQVSDYPDVRDCFCKIYGPSTPESIASATEMPLAICLAALKAVGYNVEVDSAR